MGVGLVLAITAGLELDCSGERGELGSFFPRGDVSSNGRKHPRPLFSTILAGTMWASIAHRTGGSSQNSNLPRTSAPPLGLHIVHNFDKPVLYEKLTNYLAPRYSRSAVIAWASHMMAYVRGIMNTMFLIICAVSVVFYTVFLTHISWPRCAAKKASVRKLVPDGVVDYALGRRFVARLGETMAELLLMRGDAVLLAAFVLLPLCMRAQSPQTPAETNTRSPGTVTVSAQTMERLEQHLTELESEIAELRTQVREMRSVIAPSPAKGPLGVPESAHTVADSGAQTAPQAPTGALLSTEDRGVLDFLKATTINVSIDGYYDYNFNNPIGRVNLLRAYDVSSNAFSLNQAAVIIERAPDVDAGRRYGARLDLQFGQATATLQGNPSNEARPDIYRNIFQAYGTYVVPVGSGLTVDFGKWASSLGSEGNYTQFQMNYSRGYWFNFLPFYHMGIRAQYAVNKKLALNYWLVNGTNQVEPTNGFKDEMFGFVLTPVKTLSWTVNYYFGQEGPDTTPAAVCGPVPVQPGLCFDKVSPAPDGKLHIFDTYATWQTTPRLTLQLEGDYVIQRVWASAGPDQSSAPKHTTGGAGWAKYQLTPRTYIAGRGEYLSDRGGLFSGVTEALKEFTATYDFTLGSGFEMKYEYRRDWSNQPIFLTSQQNVFSRDQNTLTVGAIWWFGRKQGPW